MSIRYVLVPVALGLVLVAVGAYVWSVRSEQLDHLDMPALRPLIDEPAPEGAGTANPRGPLASGRSTGQTVAFQASSGQFDVRQVFFTGGYHDPRSYRPFSRPVRRTGHSDGPADRKSTRLNSSHVSESRMPSSA